jgi:hypothetical protein
VSEYAGYVISDLIEHENQGDDMEGNVGAQARSVQNSGTLKNVHIGQAYGRLLQVCKTLQQSLEKCLDSLNELNPHETSVLKQELKTLEQMCRRHESK